MRARHIGLVTCTLAFGLALMLVRGEPRVWGDSGIWLSVAARMLEGDRLYADVVDNKDPLFFYTYAGALWVGGWRAPFVLDGLWLALSGISMALMLHELRAGRAAVVAGFFLYPLALTAAWYDPGATMLSGLSLAPLASWLWLRGRFVASGSVVAVVMLFKLNLALVVAAPMATLLVLGSSESSRRRQIARAGVGLSAAIGGAAVVLAARGELRAYLEIIAYNVYYSNAGLRSLGLSEGISGHVTVAREYFLAAGKWQAPVAIGAVGIFLATIVVAWRRYGQAFRLLSAVATATLLATVVTVALTVIFGEHLQLLAYPAVLMAATVISAASGALGERAGMATAVVCVLFASWSSLKHEDVSKLSLRAWSSPQLSVPGAALERARIRSFDGAGRVTYMVFGRNSEDAHAAFINDAFDLSCRWFHQYPFYRDEQFVETLECARREKPMLVLVTQSFYDPMPGSPRWESFVARARQLLEERYEMDTELGMSQVWKLR